MDLVHAAWEPEGDGPHPTLYMLHGWGANELDLLGLAPQLLSGSMLVIAPRGPIRFPLGPPGLYGHGWFPVTGGGPMDISKLEETRAELEAFIEATTERYPVDPSRRVLLGFSQGGVMAYDQALRHPEKYSALVALSSWLPPELARSVLAMPTHQLLPVLVQHGRDDAMISIDRATQSLQLLRELGLPVTFAEYDMGHEVSQESLRDLNRWLAGQPIG
jgi:phospholipase/carboxylesterase